jgi:predicted RNA-binding protein with PUA-like domain
MNNNLNTVNEILFKTLHELDSGKFETDKVKGVVQVSTTIIQNAKLQLDAHKYFDGESSKNKPKLFTGVENSKTMLQLENVKEEEQQESNGLGGSFNHKLNTAKKHGYKNVAEAIAGMGKYEFLNACKK